MAAVADNYRLIRAVLQVLVLTAGVFGAHARMTAADDEADDSGRTRRLEKMKNSAAAYTLIPEGDRTNPLKFVDAPVLRWTNPENLAKDGTVFLWTRKGRPQAILGLFTYDDDHFSHEWQSLSDGPLTAERGKEVVWAPSEPGIRFTLVKDADHPAATAVVRLRQMKALAAKFSSTFVGFTENQIPLELRLLPQPLYRYETGDNTELLDGAMFAFVQGTDPQVMLLLEARIEDKAAHWYFAFARMASGAISGRYQDQEVFSVSKYDFQRDPRRPYLLLAKQPAP